MRRGTGKERVYGNRRQRRVEVWLWWSAWLLSTGAWVGSRVAEEVDPRLTAVCIIRLGEEVRGNGAVGMRARWVHVRGVSERAGAVARTIELLAQVRRAVREGSPAVHGRRRAVAETNAGVWIAPRDVVGGVRGRRRRGALLEVRRRGSHHDMSPPLLVMRCGNGLQSSVRHWAMHESRGTLCCCSRSASPVNPGRCVTVGGSAVDDEGRCAMCEVRERGTDYRSPRGRDQVQLRELAEVDNCAGWSAPSVRVRGRCSLEGMGKRPQASSEHGDACIGPVAARARFPSSRDWNNKHPPLPPLLCIYFLIHRHFHSRRHSTR